MLSTDASLPVDHLDALRRVDRAAARLVRTWRTTLAVAVVLTVVAPLVFGWLVLLTDSPRTHLVACLAWAMVFFLNVLALLPRHREPDSTCLALEGPAGDEARYWISVVSEGWQPSRVVLAPDAAVRLTMDGTLWIGAALVACLRERELATLVRDAHAGREPLLGRRASTVHRLQVGDAGRRGDPRRRFLGRAFVRGLERRAEELDAALSLWDAAREQTRDEETRNASIAAAAVAEGLEMVVDHTLGPALQLGVWCATPFTGVSRILTAWEDAGADVWDGAREPRAAPGPIAAREALPHTMAQERDLAERLLGPVPHATEPTPWEGLPDAADIPLRRQRVAAFLESARVATGHAHPATLATVAGLVRDGWGDTVAAHLLGPQQGEAAEDDPRQHLVSVVREALADLLALTLLEAGRVLPAWSWLEGCHIVAEDGTEVDVASLVNEALPAHAPWHPEDLVAWAERAGARPREAVWLDGGVEDGPEIPLAAFLGSRGMWPPLRIVVTDRALRTFRHPWRQAYAMNVTGDVAPLDSLLDDVLAGDLAGQRHVVALRDVVHARAVPPPTAMGGWTLRMRTSEQTVKLYVMAPREELIPYLQEQWGDGLDQTWWSLPRPLFWLRTAWAWLVLSVATLGIIAAVAFLVDRDGVPGWVGALGLAAALAGILAVYVPDGLLRGWTRLRRRPLPDWT